MIYISKDLVKQMIEHSKREFPNEACGILSGSQGRVKKVYEMTNVDNSPTSFFMEPKEQLKVMKEIRNNGEEMLGIYHSHVASDAYPSSQDVELALYPEVSYVIISLKDKDNPLIRSFKLVDGNIIQEELKIE
ncbi:MAG: M67 family metallopeptidase [Candidatus Omnitrophica bacterium]|nr:M67 family metallopeptidase [Candidatus Omnitrophota bacterium]MCM8830960.1 M67 family metallopeptidase [Candidatus Omnitrophota bacterium]